MVYYNYFNRSVCINNVVLTKKWCRPTVLDPFPKKCVFVFLITSQLLQLIMPFIHMYAKFFTCALITRLHQGYGSALFYFITCYLNKASVKSCQKDINDP